MDVYHKANLITRIYVPPAERKDVYQRLSRLGMRSFAGAVGYALKAALVDPLGESNASHSKKDTLISQLADCMRLAAQVKLDKGVIIGQDAVLLYDLHLRAQQLELKRQFRNDAESFNANTVKAVGTVRNNFVYHDLNGFGVRQADSAIGKVKEQLEVVNCIMMKTYVDCIVVQNSLKAAADIAASVDPSLIGAEVAEARRHADAAGNTIEGSIVATGAYQQSI